MSTLFDRLDTLHKQMNHVLEISDKALHGPKVKTEPILDKTPKPPKKKFVLWKLERQDQRNQS